MSVIDLVPLRGPNDSGRRSRAIPGLMCTDRDSDFGLARSVQVSTASRVLHQNTRWRKTSGIKGQRRLYAGWRYQRRGERGSLRLNGTPVIPRRNDAFVFGQINIGEIIRIGKG